MTGPFPRKLARDGLRRDMFAELRAQGWFLSITRGNHICARSPEGTLVFMSGTPSDRRAFAKQLSVLRRYGFVWRAA